VSVSNLEAVNPLRDYYGWLFGTSHLVLIFIVDSFYCLQRVSSSLLDPNGVVGRPEPLLDATSDKRRWVDFRWCSSWLVALLPHPRLTPAVPSPSMAGPGGGAGWRWLQ